MERLWTVIFVFLVSAPLASAQTSEMTIKINEDALAHLTITVKDSGNIAELRGIIKEPSIHDIYQQQLGLVFGSVENLELSVDSGVFVVEFDSQIVRESNGEWIVERREFNNKMDAMATLKVTLPQDAAFVDSNPAPDKISENMLEWHDVDFVPEIRYEKRTSLPSKGLASAAIIVLVVLAAGGYFTWKKR